MKNASLPQGNRAANRTRNANRCGQTNHVIADQHQQHSQPNAVSTAQIAHLIDREIRLNGWISMVETKKVSTLN